MSTDGILRPDELATIEKIALDAKLFQPHLREILMSGLPVGLWADFPTKPTALSQLRADLATLNTLPEATGVTGPPLAIWLANAAHHLATSHRPGDRELRDWTTKVRERARAAPGDDPIARWRIHVREMHKAQVPFFDTGSHAMLATRNVIQVAVQPFARDLHDTADPFAPTTLGELLARPRSPHTPGRWVILGEPGAGKSTLARHLAWQLCAPDAPPDAPIPVLLSLARLVDKREHPFTLAERELVRLTGAGAGLADRLHALAATPDRIWLLLDGFDEVPDRAVGDAITGLKGWHHSLPHATLAVFSRPVGWAERSLGALFHRADVRPLSPEQQQALLRAWLGDDSGATVWQRIADRPSLVELAANPFMLTLLAMLSRRAAALPLTRSGLYDAAITLLLERGHCEQPSRGVASPTVARALLAAMSLTLTESGAVAWSEGDLVRTMHAARRGDRTLDDDCSRTWRGAVETALKDIAQHSGIIAAHDGAAEKWRYLHRSLRERLAAEALAAQGADAVVARVRALGIKKNEHGEEIDESRLGQWGETLGMACGLLPDPLTALEGLRAASPPLALRMLADVEALTAEDALRFIEGIDPGGIGTWDGDTLVRALRDRPGAAPALWTRVRPDTDLDRLAWLHYALDALTGPVDRERFFTAADRWPPDGPPALTVLPDAAAAARAPVTGLTLVQIPIGEFTRGDGYEAHRVLLTRPYALGVAPVTVGEYRRFDPAHRCPGDDRHPVSEVNWWRARLFAAWVGCRLPTEAEWENGCRGGTTTRYWSGGDEADLARVGWYSGNSGGHAHPVGEKPANAYGLRDVHGNVWEWAADWYADYAPADGAAVADPAGPPTGEVRVLRGGSFDGVAVFARSAERFRSWLRSRDFRIGFRLARPAPSPGFDP